MKKYSDYITIKDTNSKYLKAIYFENGIHIGDAIMDVDGFYYFKPSKIEGLWPEFSLRCVLYALRRLNKAWKDQINKDPSI